MKIDRLLERKHTADCKRVRPTRAMNFIFLIFMIFTCPLIYAGTENSSQKILLPEFNSYLISCNQDSQRLDLDCPENTEFKLVLKGKTYRIPEFGYEGFRFAFDKTILVLQGITQGSHPHADWRFIYLAGNKIKSTETYGACLWSFVPDPVNTISDQSLKTWSVEQNGMETKEINLVDLDKDGFKELVVRILPDVYMGDWYKAQAAGIVKENDDVSMWPLRFLKVNKTGIEENRNPELYKRYLKDAENKKSNFLIYYYGVMANKINKHDYKKFGLTDSVLPILDTLNLDECKSNK